jgi:hypothetical protein
MKTRRTEVANWNEFRNPTNQVSQFATSGGMLQLSKWSPKCRKLTVCALVSRIGTGGHSAKMILPGSWFGTIKENAHLQGV